MAVYVFDKEYRERHVERLEKKLAALDAFLVTVERRGGGSEIKRDGL